MITSVQSPSFKSCVPVQIYAKHPDTGKYSPLRKKNNDSKNIRKCQRYIVSNLNSKQAPKEPGFVGFYSSVDKDYSAVKAAYSYYDDENSKVYMFTGRDVDTVKEMAKPIGLASAQALDLYGNTNSPEVKEAKKNYYKNMKSFVRKNTNFLRSPDGRRLALRVYFDPIFYQKGKNKGNLKDLQFVGARFVYDATIKS